MGGETLTERKEEDELSTTQIREEIYEQFGVSWVERKFIDHVFPLLEANAQTEERYETSTRSEALAEVALFKAYKDEPKFKLFISLGVVLSLYDILHQLSPQVYGILFVGFATINGLSSSLRSPKMIAAELESVTDENGMPADYRAKALNSASTNVTIVLLAIAIVIQVLISSSVIQAEIWGANYAAGTVIHPSYTIAGLLTLLFLKGKLGIRS